MVARSTVQDPHTWERWGCYSGPWTLAFGHCGDFLERLGGEHDMRMRLLASMWPQHTVCLTLRASQMLMQAGTAGEAVAHGGHHQHSMPCICGSSRLRAHNRLSTCKVTFTRSGLCLALHVSVTGMMLPPNVHVDTPCRLQDNTPRGMLACRSPLFLPSTLAVLHKSQS